MVAIASVLPAYTCAAADMPARLTVEGVVITRHMETRPGAQAASIADGAALEAVSVRGLQGAQAFLPGANLAFVDPRQANLAVRGIGNNPVSESFHGSVPVYLDGVYLGREGMAVMGLSDIRSIALLRGPQGVLYGENASGGALDIRTRAPEFTPAARFAVGFGNRGIYRQSGGISGPLTNNLAARLSAWHAQDDGWLHNLYDGRTLDGIGRSGVRGQLLLAGSPRWSVRAIADYGEESDSQGALVVTGVGPPPQGYRNLKQGTAAVGAPPVPPHAKNYQLSNNIPQAVSVHQGGTSIQAHVRFGSFRFASISAWRFWDYSPQEDFDHSAADVYRALGNTVRHRQWSQEFQLSSTGPRRVDYTLGLYWYHQRVTSDFNLNFGQDADAALLPTPFNTLPLNVLNGGNSQLSGNETADDVAVYAHATWHVGTHLDLAAGGRVSWDRTQARSSRAAPVGFGPSLLPLVNSVRQTLVGAADSGSLQRHDLGFAGLLQVDWNWDERTRSYLRLSSNQKPGGFNLGGAGITRVPGIDPLRFGPENTRAIEIGTDYHDFNDRLLAHIDLYLMRVNGYQASGILWSKQSFGNSPVGILTNTGDVGSSGVEWSLSGKPANDLTLSLYGAYTDARYRSFANAPCSAEHNPGAPPTCDLSGQRVSNSPVLMLNALARYRWNWTARLAQTAALTYAWRSGVYGSLDDSRYNRLPAYGLLDAATILMWKHGSQHFGLRLWGHNLTNVHYFTGGGAIPVGYAYVAAAGPTRSYGLTVIWRFS